jgi:hypothetical protein
LEDTAWVARTGDVNVVVSALILKTGWDAWALKP